ncbi:hypothetical protein BKA58DRAFT_455390 [Alternaria rosae]|uniref:uncharacterized protein n=1 Tax=Alternaria rosae TaxID=1187941 RepID=UPI001E8D6E54|nr:uncharacterized protein BKA58DRAFT_455390 [Alternaria rosae]KAH6876238.1 hypothetical protein BKA58DRAFT_455390 [Alternaria rosae]
MRTITGELMVCGNNPGIPEIDREISAENDVDYVFAPEDMIPTGTFTLGLLADASIALRRKGSALETVNEDERSDFIGSTPRARRHALDSGTSSSVKAFLVTQTDSRTPHGPAHQPPTEKLLKTVPTSLRNRAKSLHEPQPLPFRWTLPPNVRFRIGDPEAFAALQVKNIEWYVTTGLLVEDFTGLRWNAGSYTYLLYWHVEGMPTPDGSADAGRKWLSITQGFMRDCQKEKWEREFGDDVLVVEDEPATPIVEREDLGLIKLPNPVVTVGSRPPTPSRERCLFPGSKSALRSSCQSRPVSPSPSPVSDTGSESPRREKKVRLLREKRKRFVVLEVDDDDDVPVAEEGKFVETMVDEMDVLSDNEGRTARN